MFKRLSVIVVLLFGLQGCYQTVTAREALIAEAWCSDKGGVDYIAESILGQTTIVCFNGESQNEFNILKEFRSK